MIDISFAKFVLAGFPMIKVDRLIFLQSGDGPKPEDVEIDRDPKSDT